MSTHIECDKCGEECTTELMVVVQHHCHPSSAPEEACKWLDWEEKYDFCQQCSNGIAIALAEILGKPPTKEN